MLRLFLLLEFFPSVINIDDYRFSQEINCFLADKSSICVWFVLAKH